MKDGGRRHQIFRKAFGALAHALDRLMADPGAQPVQIKTGAVVVEHRRAAAADVFAQILASLEAKLPTPRIIPADSPVPATRVRQINPIIEERYAPVPMNLDHLSVAEIAKLTSNGNVPIGGWRVSQHVTLRRGWEHMSAQELREHVLSLSIAPEDDTTYNGFYPTIRGSDVAHHDPNKQGMAAFQGGNVLKGHATYDEQGRMTHDGTIRGGVEITGGRSQYKRATKGYEHFDLGWDRDIDRIRAEQAAKRQQATDIEVAIRDAKLPRKIGEL